MFHDLTEFHEWFAERGEANDHRVTRVPLDDLPGWRTNPRTGDLEHDSGKFFAVRGLRVATDHGPVPEWSQPIIVQPEIGVLGIVVKVVGGRVSCLLQAKMEPGNVNVLQLSPTVQATRSNYTGVHKGGAVPYLELFMEPGAGRTVHDSLQSEQGSWYLAKRNRNTIIEVDEDPPLLPDFCWLDLAQVAALLTEPNVVNMDTRTVLSGMPFLFDGPAVDRGPVPPPPPDADGPLHSTGELLSWFTGAKARYSLTRSLVPLAGIEGWRRSGDEIAHEQGGYFSIIGVDVRAPGREVPGWSQPMLAPRGRGVIAFLGRSIGGRFHLLVQARTEAGTHDVVEMAPTVQTLPSNHTGVPIGRGPRFLDAVERAAQGSALVDVVHSEEGGRLYRAENRYLVVDVGEDFGLDVPDDFCWMTVDQLVGFTRYGNHVDVEARCLLSCLVADASPLAPVRDRP